MKKSKADITKENVKLVVDSPGATLIEIIDKKSVIVASVKAKEIAVPQNFFLDKGKYEVRSDGEIEKINIEKREIPEFPSILLTSDAPDVHPVDGIGEIPADGSSYCTIFVKKIGSAGQPLKREKDQDELYIRTDNGLIKDNKGENEIRKIKLKKGEGSFRLYSGVEKRVARIKVLCKESPMLGTIEIEFT